MLPVTSLLRLLLGFVAVWMVAAGPTPPPPDVVIVSSTTVGGPFQMTVSNRSASAADLVLPSPVPGAMVTVDTGTWDGSLWSLELAPGATATLDG